MFCGGSGAKAIPLIQKGPQEPRYRRGADLTLHPVVSAVLTRKPVNSPMLRRHSTKGWPMWKKRTSAFTKAELHRLRGEMLLTESPMDAEAEFCNAIKTARLQHSKALELRAATSLARPLAQTGPGKRGPAPPCRPCTAHSQKGFRRRISRTRRLFWRRSGNEHMREDFAAA